MDKILLIFGLLLGISVQIMSLTITPKAEMGSFGFKSGFLNNPIGISVFRSSLFVVNSHNQRVSVFNNKFKYRYNFDQINESDGLFNDLSFPTHIAIGERGLIYLVDSDESVVHQFDILGRVQRTFGGFGSKGLKFNSPSGIDVDDFGFVYICDTDNNRILKITETGDLVFKILENEGNLKKPVDIQMNLQLDILVLDRFGLKVFTELGKFKTLKIAINGASSFTMDNKENIYLTLPDENLVRVYNKNGDYLTQITEFEHPIDSTFQDPFLYVTDSKKNKVFKFEIN
ncbi:hypothetical protein DID80_05320 [Candidatus Marinamargulisbacteria bacterium SCGC AAA071-K20]|nr:hypothetical protein DID80_05320 [Candidatus Marinamargulisbacteria bacterium SCGC AAA071-K20]